MMKRQVFIMCLLLCSLLLCGCSSPPLSHPPADSYLGTTAEVRLEGKQVVYKDVTTTDIVGDATWHYHCRMENGVEQTEKNRGALQHRGTLPYGDYCRVLDRLQQQLQEDKLVLTDRGDGVYQIRYQRGSKDMALVVRNKTVDEETVSPRYMGWYTYYVKEAVWMQGGKDYEDRKPLGILEVRNYMPIDLPDGGTDDRTDLQYAYVIIYSAYP